MLKLLIDVGNSRIKWAVADGNRLLLTGAVASVEQLKDKFSKNTSLSNTDLLNAQVSINDIGECVIAAVGCVQKVAQLVQWAGQKDISCKQLQTSLASHGIRCAYRDSSAWGVDRWLALLGARSSLSDVNQKASIAVVDCGTAITLDVMDGEGRHLGGLITTGLGLMRAGLNAQTENISVSANNAVMQLASDTATAVTVGTASSALGFLQWIRDNSQYYLEGSTENAIDYWFLTGGDALTLAGLAKTMNCDFDWIVEPNLVLHGMRVAANAL